MQDDRVNSAKSVDRLSSVSDVPEVLLSGHHGQIERWRREQRLRLTAQHRPELLAAARAAGRLDKLDEKYLGML